MVQLVRLGPVQPAGATHPQTEDEVVESSVHSQTGQTVGGVAGTGHSFTPLCASDDVLISLDGLTGIESVDTAACRGLDSSRYKNP